MEKGSAAEKFRFSFVKQVTEEHIKIIDLAYRRPQGFGKSWTGEGHLIGGPRTTLEQLQAQIEQPDIRLIECRVIDDNVLVGSVQLERKSETVAGLGLLNVDPFRQGEGIGGQMLRYAMKSIAVEWPQVTELEIWVLEKRFELIAWYQRLGFTFTGEKKPFPKPEAAVGQPNEYALQEYQGQLTFAVMRKSLK